MVDWITVAFVVCVITSILGSIAVFLRNKKQIRLFFSIALFSLLIVVVLMIVLAASGGA